MPLCVDNKLEANVYIWQLQNFLDQTWWLFGRIFPRKSFGGSKSPFIHRVTKFHPKTNNSYKAWWVLLNVLYSLNSFQIASHIMQIHKELPTLKNEKSSTNNTCGSLMVLINVIAPNRIFQVVCTNKLAIFHWEMRSWQHER